MGDFAFAVFSVYAATAAAAAVTGGDDHGGGDHADDMDKNGEHQDGVDDVSHGNGGFEGCGDGNGDEIHGGVPQSGVSRGEICVVGFGESRNGLNERI